MKEHKTAVHLDLTANSHSAILGREQFLHSKEIMLIIFFLSDIHSNGADILQDNVFERKTIFANNNRIIPRLESILGSEMRLLVRNSFYKTNRNLRKIWRRYKIKQTSL